MIEEKGYLYYFFMVFLGILATASLDPGYLIFKLFCDCDSDCDSELTDEMKEKIDQLDVTAALLLFLIVIEIASYFMENKELVYVMQWILWSLASAVILYTASLGSEIMNGIIFLIIILLTGFMILKKKESIVLIIPMILIMTIYKGIVLIYACEEPSKVILECDSEEAQDPEVCKGAGMICKTDKNKSSEECGTCSKSGLLDKTSCEAGEGDNIWTSQMSSCYWVTPYPTEVTDPPSDINQCVYDLDKCDCSTFEATNSFNECCPIPNNWTNCSIQEDLDKLEADLREGEITTEKLAAIYNHKNDASHQCSRRGELDMGYYE